MIWKSLDTGSEYEVSDTGLVRKVHMMSQSKDRDGYFRVSITDPNKKGKSRPVHRLILHAFDPRPNEEELEVHHIDGNPANNNLENLMWVTHEENINFIPKEKLFANQFIARKVAQYDENGTLMHNRIPDPMKCKINRMTYEIKEINGYSDKQVEEFMEIIKSTAHLIMEFAKEGGFEHASGF